MDHHTEGFFVPAHPFDKPIIRLGVRSQHMPTAIFTKELSQAYDERNAKLAPIAENAHFLVRLVLKDLPVDGRVLCVGVGTWAEILSLTKSYPGLTFVGVDPSEPMLDVCRTRLSAAGILNRCELLHGYVEDTPAGETFDAALSMLVGHFVEPAERPGFYHSMVNRLKPGGHLVNCEISADMDSADFPLMLENWKQVQALMGASDESLANLAQTLRTALTVLSPSDVENLLRQSGVHPVRFFQSFMIVGWHGVKGK
jgi:tRNA (cmo5U34)-methyltransferase